jgi:hypothetical protein
LDGPPKPEDFFRLHIYFIHGRVLGSELNPCLASHRFLSHIYCTTSGVSVSYSPTPQGVHNSAAATDNQHKVLALLKQYRDDWRAGHDRNHPEAGHFIMGHLPAAITPELIASAFGFSGQLLMTDAQGSDQRHLGGAQPLWGASFAGTNLTFARTHILAYKQGTFLTPALEAGFTNALQQIQAGLALTVSNTAERTMMAKDLSKSFGRFDLPANIHGYVRYGFGGCELVAQIPHQSLDLLLTINLPNGDAGPFYLDTPQTHEYYTIMRNSPGQLLRDALPVILKVLK